MADVLIKTYPKAYYEGAKTLDGNPYRLKIRWSTAYSKWYLAITSLADAEVTVRGIALLCGRDLLAPFGYSHLLGELRLIDTSNANEDPDFYGMGDRWKLYYTPRVT